MANMSPFNDLKDMDFGLGNSESTPMSDIENFENAEMQKYTKLIATNKAFVACRSKTCVANYLLSNPSVYYAVWEGSIGYNFSFKCKQNLIVHGYLDSTPFGIMLDLQAAGGRGYLPVDSIESIVKMLDKEELERIMIAVVKHACRQSEKETIPLQFLGPNLMGANPDFAATQKKNLADSASKSASQVSNTYVNKSPESIVMMDGRQMIKKNVV